MSNRQPAAALENRQRTCDETKVLGYPAPEYEADHRRDTRGRPDRPASRNHILPPRNDPRKNRTMNATHLTTAPPYGARTERPPAPRRTDLDDLRSFGRSPPHVIKISDADMIIHHGA
jgi:hypothetical protein